MLGLKYTPEQRRYLAAKGAQIEDVEPENQFMWQAYQLLRASRMPSEGILWPIQISEITAYCDLIGLTDKMQRVRVARYVMELDRAEAERWRNLD